ncbi:MAG: hypothetical protein ACLS63_04535 [Flavonifractor plautii]
MYAFSTENWKRPSEGGGPIMGLLKKYLSRPWKWADGSRWFRISPPAGLRLLCGDGETRHYDGVQVNICLNTAAGRADPGGRAFARTARPAGADPTVEGFSIPSPGACPIRIW